MAKHPAGWKYAAEQVPLLNKRQREILDLIEQGLTNQEIANHFEITLSGAKWYVSELLGLLAMASREEMAEFWAWRGARTRSLPRFGLAAVLRTKWLGMAAASAVAAAIAVPWLVLRGGESDAVPTPGDVAAISPVPTLVISLPATRSLAAYQKALPAKGPEGRLAYIDTAGNLLVKPMPSGAPAVARTPAYIRTPRWSPSGDYLAIVENGFLLVIDETGKFAQLANMDRDGTWAWSPAEDTLALFTGEGFVLYDAKSGAQRVLRGQGAPLPEQPGSLFWSPDGSRILYSLSAGVSAAQIPSVSELRVVDIRSGADTELIRRDTPPQSGTPAIGWSGDGQSVFYRDLGVYASSAWVDGVPLYVMASSGGAATKLGISLGGGDMFSPRPGADDAAYLQGGGRFASLGVRRVELVGGLERIELAQAAAGSHSAVAWSPDGRLLAYTALPQPPPATFSAAASGQEALDLLRTRKLWLQAPGEAARQLTSDPDYRDEHPVWSQNGASILFTRIDAAGKASAWRSAEAGGPPELVAGDLGLGGDGPLGIYGWVHWEELIAWSLR